MKQRDPIFTPELIKILKIFIFSALGVVLFLSFFDSYRADNTGEDRTFRVADSDRIYFQNVRSINYERENRNDAGMVLFRHRQRLQSESRPTLDLVILINPTKDEAYIYFELKNAEWPIQIQVDSLGEMKTYDFANGNNQDHFSLFQNLLFAIEKDLDFELTAEGESYPLWAGEKEKQALKTVMEDYLRLLAKTD